jgi:hypothetical protein
MADRFQMLADFLGQIAFHDLAMIEVELKPQIRPRHRGQDAPGRRGRVEEITGHVAGVDRFDQQGDAVRGQPVGRAAQIGDIDRLGLVTRDAGMDGAGHGVQPAAVQGPGIIQRLVDGDGEFLLPAGQGGQSALAAGKVARPQIEQHLLKPGIRQDAGQFVRGVIVGEQIFNALKPAVRRCREPVGEGQFGEHHRQIGGKFRHGDPAELTKRKLARPLKKTVRAARGETGQAETQRLACSSVFVDAVELATQTRRFFLQGIQTGFIGMRALLLGKDLGFQFLLLLTHDADKGLFHGRPPDSFLLTLNESRQRASMLSD